MKTLFCFLCVGALCGNISAQSVDKLENRAHAKPMLLCYAVRDTSDRANEWKKPLEDQRKITSSRADTRETPISVSSVGYRDGTDADTVPGNNYSTQGLFLTTRSTSECERRNRAKFCLDNLLEGSLYDFKKKNELRFEIGSPKSECRDNCSQLKYEQFCVTFLIRLKL